jgi:hypothetical protein
MGRMGMQLPGGMRRATPMMNVYTGLVFAAVASLIAACVIVYVNGAKIGPEGNALGTHASDAGGKGEFKLSTTK